MQKRLLDAEPRMAAGGAGDRGAFRRSAGCGMSNLPRGSGRECVTAGFHVRRQEGSDIILRRDDPFSQVVVPDRAELDRGTLRAIIRQAGLCVDGYLKLQ